MRGSSPLTRGKPLRVRRAIQHQGLIPAHAGKTHVRVGAGRRPRAHPRSRGENGRPILSHATKTGSSPLTRGKLSVVVEWFQTNGLIPAHAGKTGWRASRGRWRRAHPRSRGENIWGSPTAGTYKAHPRSRGENCKTVMMEPHLTGSSPLTRGKRWGILTGVRMRGLIPAHAGKT